MALSFMKPVCSVSHSFLYLNGSEALVCIASHLALLGMTTLLTYAITSVLSHESLVYDIKELSS